MKTDDDPHGEPGPSAMVESFIAAMNAWEIATASAHRRARDAGLGAAFDGNRPMLAEIFLQHCTPRDRPYGRLAAPTFQRPPEYDPATESIVETTIKKAGVAWVETHRAASLGGRFRYTLHLRSGRWAIDSVARLGGGGWVKETL